MWEYWVDEIDRKGGSMLLQEELYKAGLDGWKMRHIERLDAHWMIVYEQRCGSSNPVLQRALVAHAKKKAEAG